MREKTLALCLLPPLSSATLKMVSFSSLWSGVKSFFHLITLGQELWAAIGAGAGLGGILLGAERDKDAAIVTSWLIVITLPLGGLISCGFAAAFATTEMDLAWQITLLVIIDLIQLGICFYLGQGSYIPRQQLEEWAMYLEGGTIRELRRYMDDGTGVVYNPVMQSDELQELELAAREAPGISETEGE